MTRPLADRVAGVDEALLRAAAVHGADVDDLVELRFATALFVDRFGQTVDRLGDGCTALDLLVAELIDEIPAGFDSDDELLEEDIMVPLATGVLARCEHPADAVLQARVLVPALRGLTNDDTLAEDVALEILELFALAR